MSKYLIWSNAEYGLGTLGTNLKEADATKIVILKREEPNTYFLIKVLGNNEDYYVVMNETDNKNYFTSADMACVLKNINTNNLPVYMTMLRAYEEPVPAEGILDICNCDEMIALKTGNSTDWFNQEDVCNNAEDEVEKFVFDFTSGNGQLLFAVDVPLNSHRFIIEEKLFVKLYEDKFLNEIKEQGNTNNDKASYISSIIETICTHEGWKYYPVAFIYSETTEEIKGGMIPTHLRMRP